MKTGGSQRTHTLDTKGPFIISVTNTGEWRWTIMDRYQRKISQNNG